MLTPIRVRGRRKKHSPSPSTLKQGDTAGSSSTRTQGRPLLSVKDRSQLENERRRWLLRGVSRNLADGRQQQQQQRSRLSKLESLPFELIETIFLFACNVNFARASPVLAGAISTERIYRALILLSFWDNDDASLAGANAVAASSTAISQILRRLEFAQPLSAEERTALQSDILQCKWCTLSRITRHLPDLMRLVVHMRWLDAGVSMEEDQKASLLRFLAGEEGNSRTFEGTRVDGARVTLSIDSPFSITTRSADTGQQDGPATETKTHRVLSVKVFPEKILRLDKSGFSEDAITLLELFRIASGFDTVEPSAEKIKDIWLSPNVLQQGIHFALVERSARALTVLLKIDEYVTRSAAQRNLLAAEPYALPAEHFRIAVRAAPRDPSMFQLLLRTSAESIPADDAEITQWAMECKGEFGDWLLDLMVMLPELVEGARADPTRGPMFYMGRANERIEMIRRYLEQVLKVNELPSWMGDSFLDPAGGLGRSKV